MGDNIHKHAPTTYAWAMESTIPTPHAYTHTIKSILTFLCVTHSTTA